MPIIKHQLPKYCKVKVKKKLYAAVYLSGKTVYLGAYGSPESKTAYTRLVAGLKADAVLYRPQDKENVSVKELVLSFLDHVRGTIAPQNFGHHRAAVRELLKLYDTNTPASSFTPSCLKLFRQELIKSKRFCRKTINDYTRRIVFMFIWGIEEELVEANTAIALRAIKPLPEGYPGTFDHPEREEVPDCVIMATLPFMPPTLQAMIKLQRLTGMRPCEVFNMRVGEIDRTTDPELWLYRLPTHKTQKKTKRKKVIPLSKIEQELIAPYLENKNPDAAVFSPRTAMAERNAERKANRKTKLTPSQIARAKERESKPTRYKEFYNKDSYRNAVLHAITKGNKVQPDNEQIPYWCPYQIRHTAATAMERESGLDEAQALLDHASAQTTKRYSHARLQKMKELARNRRDIFAEN
jgi:integrase